jgi:hypothetical protein
MDLVVPKGTLQDSVDVMSNINSAIEILNLVNPAPLTRVALGVATKVIGLKLFNAKNADVNEREALYNLKVEVLDTDDSLFYPDARVRDNECGATTLNMASSVNR